MIPIVAGLILALGAAFTWTLAAREDHQCCFGFGLVVAGFLWLAVIEITSLTGIVDLRDHWIRQGLYRFVMLIAPLFIIGRHRRDRRKR